LGLFGLELLAHPLVERLLVRPAAAAPSARVEQTCSYVVGSISVINERLNSDIHAKAPDGWQLETIASTTPGVLIYCFKRAK
jgi:hypothetical protein